jgi:hypothetical protein
MERSKLFIELLQLIPKGSLFSLELELDTLVLQSAKTAQLKLIECLLQPCKHTLYAGPGRTIRRISRLIDCPECMAELKKQLREG